MISAWRAVRKTSRKIMSGEKSPGKIDVAIPNHFLCPISLELMKDPVTLCTGITYDRQSIDTWIDAGNRTCPVTNQILKNLEQIPNHMLRKMIQDWCVANSSSGFVRIPTPRIPVTTADIVKILPEILSSDPVRCRTAVAKLRSLGKESERNRKCIAGAVLPGGATAGAVLASAVELHAGNPSEFAGLCKEILAVMTWLYPLDSSALASLGSPRSLRCMAWLLKCGDLAGMKIAVLAVKEVSLSSDVRHLDALGEIEGLPEALVGLIRSPICPSATKASLMVVSQLTSSSTEKTRLKIINADLVPALLDTLTDSDRGVCERALVALDGVCSSQQGRERAYEHALTVPILVKKILRVSELATEFSISALWKLSKNPGGEGILMEALQVGAFQKLLLLLQVSYGEGTKEKATNLLKMLNSYRSKMECVDPMDFKQLKRTFD